MANIRLESAPTSKSYPIGWLVGICNLVWKRIIPWFWTGIIVAFALGVLVNWATDFHKVPDILVWMYTHIMLVIIITISLVSLTILTGVIGQLPQGTSERAIKRRYLSSLITRYTHIRPLGMPTSATAWQIDLDKVFIHPLFHRAAPTDFQSPSEDEINTYRNSLARNVQPQEISLLLREKAWEARSREAQSTGIAEVWENLTEKEPAAVIQGDPGTGKSTLLERLTLFMARRVQDKTDPDQTLSVLTPALIPIFISLREYVSCKRRLRNQRNEDLSILDFIQQKVADEIKPSLSSFIQQWLEDCQCLVLFDGLDEVSDKDERKYVQEAIIHFVGRYSNRHREIYNRFLITTRVAGYDIHAFPYPNYIIAELTPDQIEDILPHWCYESVASNTLGVNKEEMRSLSIQLSETISSKIEENPRILKMAQTPLLLKLIVDMQREEKNISGNRVELYENAIVMLLQKRDEARNIEALDIEEVIPLLGEIAYEMHKTGEKLISRQSIVEFLEEALLHNEKERVVHPENR